MEISDIRKLYTDVLTNVRTVMIGSDRVFSLIFSAILAGGHVLLEDNPGTGKTTMARCIAESIDCTFKRVQFTPDLMPQDITGLNIYSQKDTEFHFVAGPVFTNVLLADEINRATPRTQSALLQAMEESMITVDGEDMELASPFIVIATENPLETSGTFPLPEAQLDRFMIKVTMGDITRADEAAILARFLTDNPEEEIRPVCTAADITAAAEVVRTVKVAEPVMQYIVDIAAATRSTAKIFSGTSPRASLNLMRMAQAFAAISDRSFVTPDDVRVLAPYVLAHRIVPTSGSMRLRDVRDIIAEVVAGVSVPVEDWE